MIFFSIINFKSCRLDIKLNNIIKEFREYRYVIEYRGLVRKDEIIYFVIFV